MKNTLRVYCSQDENSARDPVPSPSRQRKQVSWKSLRRKVTRHKSVPFGDGPTRTRGNKLRSDAPRTIGKIINTRVIHSCEFEGDQRWSKNSDRVGFCNCWSPSRAIEMQGTGVYAVLQPTASRHPESKRRVYRLSGVSMTRKIGEALCCSDTNNLRISIHPRRNHPKFETRQRNLNCFQVTVAN